MILLPRSSRQINVEIYSRMAGQAIAGFRVGKELRKGKVRKKMRKRKKEQRNREWKVQKDEDDSDGDWKCMEVLII